MYLTIQRRDLAPGSFSNIQLFLTMAYDPSAPNTPSCKCCGTESMIVMRTPVYKGDPENGDAEESEGDDGMIYRCPVCDDGWTSLKLTLEGKGAEEAGVEDGTCRVVFIHQEDYAPRLRRHADFASKLLVGQEGAMRGGWNYFVGDKEVEADKWHEMLEERRDMIRSVVVN